MPKRTPRSQVLTAIFKAARSLGITRAALARKAGINPSVLYNAEKGAIRLGEKRLQRLRDVGANL